MNLKSAIDNWQSAIKRPTRYRVVVLTSLPSQNFVDPADS